jgi:hypothetical protein
LRESTYHFWVEALNGMVKQVAYLVAICNMGLEFLIILIFLSGRFKKRNENTQLTRERISRRMQIERHDLIAGLLKKDDTVFFNLFIL